MAPIIVRSATPKDDEFLAWSILAATRSHLSRGWFDIALDKPEKDCLNFLARLTTAQMRSPWHYSRFLVAGEIAERPAAALCAVSSPDAYRESAIALLTCMKSLGVNHSEREAFWKRGAYLFKCTGHPDKDSLIIEVAAALPSSRNRGYVSALLTQALADGRSQGLRKAETSCFTGNLAAERTYIRAGFSFAGERRDPEFEAAAGAAGIRRFTMEL